MDPWVWAVLLLVVGMCLVVLEIFVPSGGILAVLTICAVLASIGLAFYQSPAMGVAILGAAVVGLPIVIVLALRWLPETAVGQRVLLKPPSSADVVPEISQREALLPLVGRIGRARCKMLPSGIVQIENRTYDAVGEGMAIDEGQRVRVIEVRGNRLIVEGIRDDEAVASDDPLARPIDWDNLDPPRPPSA
ncbi:MAG: hypothetical protein NUV77_00365 [Thermoguttaceae bacterium]|jgi:membrane-bound serine protease (ClpP class)|nr:hypothetical protein [Thermoguttaceae bacterium]